jgi:hypothetical protein
MTPAEIFLASVILFLTGVLIWGRCSASNGSLPFPAPSAGSTLE